MTDWAAVRAEFPALDRWTFLNTASFGQMPRRGTEAVTRYFSHRDEFACHDFLDWFDDLDRIRESVARLIGAEPSDIAFIPNASTGLSMVLAGLDLKPGDRVVTLEGEFPNFLYLPALLSRREVEFVEVPWEGLYEAVNGSTRIVAVSGVRYTNGFRAPVAELGRRLRERGVMFFLDRTQSVGALRFDAAETGVDVLAVHGYKWMVSPVGAGFLYMRREWRDRIPPNVVGWRSHRDWRNVDNLHHGSPQLKTSAEKYEGGMLPFADLYAMGAAVGMMLEIGVEEIERRVLELAARARAILTELGGEVEHRESQITAAHFPGVDPSPLTRALEERRVLVSARHGHLRVSTHFYNNDDDLETLGRELKRLL